MFEPSTAKAPDTRAFDDICLSASGKDGQTVQIGALF
jgi:hypothetical protein